MTLARRFGFSLMVATALACHSDGIGPVAAFNYATAHPQCGPADGPATEIFVSASPLDSQGALVPFVRIYVAVGVEELNGHIWSVSGSSPAAAWFHPVITGGQVAATGGTLTVTSVGADKSIDGSIDLSFPDAGRIRGEFHAVWIPGGAVCV
jgi:hypothetical protein